MAASENLRFDITANDRASDAFSRVGRSASDMGGKLDAASWKGKILQDVIEKLGSKEDRTAAQSLNLAKALRLTGDEEDRVAARALVAEAAVSRLGEAMKKDADATRKAAAEKDGFAAALQRAADAAKGAGGPAWLGPALALTPAIGTLGGAALGAAAGLSGAAVAGASALAAFGAVAKPVLADALTAEQAVNTAQNNYNAAIAGGTKQAVAYKAEQIAISKAYAELSPAQIALSRQLGAMSEAWQNLKAAETPVVAGALQPWLMSVTDLTGKLAPVIGKVSVWVGLLGSQFDSLINSAAFTAFRDFVASTGSAAVGAAGNLLISMIQAFITLLPKFNPLIEKTIGWLGDLGPAILKWSGSKKTADDITKFMAWFTTNGPAVGGFLTNLGLALKALAPGLTSGGVTELKLISDFFGWVAKLPPSIAKPLAEVAGALLILNKLGVFKAGVELAFPKDGGAAASWGKLLPGVALRFAGGAAIATVAIQAAGSLVPKDMNQQAATDLKKQPPLVVKITDFLHVTNIGGWIDQYFSHPVRAWLENSLPNAFADAGHVITRYWDDAMKGMETAALGMGVLVLKGFRDVANGALTAIGTMLHGLATAFGWIPGGIGSSLKAASGHFDDFKANFNTGINSNIDHLQAMQAKINAMHGKTVPVNADTNQVSRNVPAAQRLIDAMHGKTVGVNVHEAGSGGLSAKSKFFTGNFALGTLAAGGLVGGKLGTRGPDDRIAQVRTGEFVVHPGATAKWLPFLEHINSYASGGLVGSVDWAANAGGTFGADAGVAFAKAGYQAFQSGANSYAPPGGGGNYPPGVATVARYIMAHGGSREAGAGVGGVVMGESGGDPEAIQFGGGGTGIIQWTPGSSAFPIQPIWTGNASRDMGVQLIDMMAYIGSRGGLGSINAAAMLAGGGLNGAMAAAWRFSAMEAPLVPGSDIRSGTVATLYAQGLDRGGYLPPGLSLAYNGTGRPEPVGPARGGSTYVINVHASPLAQPADIGREVVGAIRAHEKRSGKGWRTP